MEATCHCKAVRISLAQKPEFLVSCNCSLCHRYGTLWCHFPSEKVTVECEEGATKAYRWGDETIDFHHCTSCGCVTHWSNVEGYENPRTAINARLFDRTEAADIKIRKFDGADSWKFVEE